MVCRYGGPVSLTCSTDSEGYRTYKATFQVFGTWPIDGPASAMQCPGLPAPGSYWHFGGDIDVWVWARHDREVSPAPGYKTGDPVEVWHVTSSFSNKPDNPGQKQRCSDQKIEHPLLELPKVSGGTSKYNEEAVFDRFGRRITNSSHEQLRGQHVEFDVTRGTVKIEYNVPTFEWVSLALSMMNTVNAYTLWGQPRRCVKLSDVPWERQYHGLCNAYYKLTLQFDIDPRTFDRNIGDVGTMVLKGHWDPLSRDWVLDNIGGFPPDSDDPRCFIRAKDREMNPIKVVLDGRGKPYSPDRPYIEDCSICDRTFQYFQVQGFDEREELNVLLSHQTACVWANPAAGVSLSYDLGDEVWKLSTGFYVDGDWQHDGDEWDCTGPNTLQNVGQGSIASRGPQEVRVFPSGGTAPGNIHVEKYTESNFLLLGIPATL